MSDDHNRGAYTPQSDAPLAFDARHSRGPGERPMPVTLIVSGIVLLLLIIGGIVFVVRGSGGDPAAPATNQPIEAMKTAPPADVQDAKPVDQQGLQIGYTEGQPMATEPGVTPPGAPVAPGSPNFTARPEAPAARPAPGTPPAPPPVAVIQPLPNKTAPTALAPAPKVETRTVEAKPVARPEPKTEARPLVATSAGPRVQIGAFSSNALAEQSWNGVASKIPGRIAGKTLHVEKADVDGKTYHRAQIGGFTSRADADSFCSALKAQGGDCSVRN